MTKALSHYVAIIITFILIMLYIPTWCWYVYRARKGKSDRYLECSTTNKLRVILQQILRTDTLTVVKARFQSVISIEIGIELTMYMYL